jgi:hypothetical protein
MSYRILGPLRPAHYPGVGLWVFNAAAEHFGAGIRRPGGSGCWGGWPGRSPLSTVGRRLWRNVAGVMVLSAIRFAIPQGFRVIPAAIAGVMRMLLRPHYLTL